MIRMVETLIRFSSDVEDFEGAEEKEGKKYLFCPMFLFTVLYNTFFYKDPPIVIL